MINFIFDVINFIVDVVIINFIFDVINCIHCACSPIVTWTKLFIRGPDLYMVSQFLFSYQQTYRQTDRQKEICSVFPIVPFSCGCRFPQQNHAGYLFSPSGPTEGRRQQIMN